MTNTPVNRLSVRVAGAPGLSGDFSVGVARTGYRGFGVAHDGLSFDVVAIEGTAWEVRRACLYDHATATLTRGTLEDSSTGAALNLSAAAIVTVTLTAAALAELGRAARLATVDRPAWSPDLEGLAYYDLTLHKLVVAGAADWEVITSV